MAGSRSAVQRKRKRDTTSRTVDFLNNLNSPTDRVSHSSPVWPRRPLRRQTAPKTQVPQSDGALSSRQSSEPCGSPVTSPIPQREPITPRRSSRKTGPAQPDGSTKLVSDSISDSDESPISEFDHGSDESENHPVKRSGATGNSPQPHEQNENTRSPLTGESPWSLPASNPVVEIEVRDASSDDDEDSDKSEDPGEVASHKTQPQSIREASGEKEIDEDSPAQPPLRGKSGVGVDFDEVDDSDDDSGDNLLVKFDDSEENPSRADENIPYHYEETDPTRVIFFSSDYEDEVDERHRREFSPSQQLQHEQEMNANNDGVTEDTAANDHEQERNVNNEDVAKSTAIPVDEETTVVSKEVTNDTSMPELAPETDVVGEAVAEDAAEESEYSPSEGSSASESSPAASDLFRYTPEASPATSPKGRRRSEDNHRQLPVVELPSQQRASSVWSSLQSRSTSPDERAASPASTESTKKSVHKGESPWFTKAKLLGGQKRNWEILVSETLAASQLVSPSRAHYFQKIETLMTSLQEEYGVVLDSLENQCPPSPETRRKCRSLRRSLEDEGDQLREMIYYRAVRRDEKSKLLGGRLAEEFESRVYHPMVRLVLQCFEAYRHSDMRRLFPSAYSHLLQTMKLLHKFCRRSNAQQARGYVSFRSRSGHLVKILSNLIEALEAGALRDSGSTAASSSASRRRQQRSATRQVHETTSTPSPDRSIRTRDRRHSNDPKPSLAQREWTDDEGFALLEGLRRWQGPERYHQILEHFPRQLGGRTVQELRAQAQLIHDTWAPHFAKKATRQEQRQQWQWLMEV